MKRGIIILILLVLALFSVSGIFAADVNDALEASEDNIEIGQPTGDVICVEENIELDSSAANEVLKANEQTFTQLDMLINDNADRDIYLESDYKYFEDDVIDFREGIVINRDVNIHGNGHTIDANGESRIFQINGGDVVFYNITFVNGVTVGDDCGSAINGDCKAINCTFKQNQADLGGAMCGGFAINCTFIDNSARSFGGAMSDGYAVNCIFINNTADYAGALSNGSAVNCIFTGNRAWGWGGAMSLASAVNCTFVDNRGNEFGGATYECSAVNCIFRGNYAELGGAAMADGYAVNCSGQTNDFYSISELVLHFEADDLITLYGSGQTLPIKLRNQQNKLIGFIDYDVVVRNKNGVVTTYHCLSNDDLSFDLLPGIYTAELVVTCPCLSQTDRKSITLTVTDGKTFWDLNKTINGNSNKVITLDKDYAYNQDFDSDFTEGINITRKVTINGNGHIIDGNGQARIFWVKGDNVNINNITFVNGKAGNGGAITWEGANGRLFDSSFTGNNALYGYGGAIYWEGADGMISSSSFTGNNAVNGYGGAIYWGGADGAVSSSSFIGNNAEIENGGAIYWWGSNGNVSASSFTGNKAKDRHGGAIYWWSSNGIISGSSFIGNNASNSGGAIFCKSANVNISNSIFINNNAAVEGDAIYSDVLLMADCCWFGANATNYMDALPIDGKAHCERILFLNATANPDIISVSGTSDVIFKLFLFNSTSQNTTEYDNTPFGKFNLTVMPTNGNVSKNIAGLAEPITFTATGRGTGSITAKIENAVYTIELNIKYDPNLSFEPQQSDYSDSTNIAISYNQSATGTVNITLKGKNGNNYAFTNIALNGTILLQDAISADEYEVNVTYSGDHDFLNATAAGTLTINKANSTLSVNDITFDYEGEGSCEVIYTGAVGVEAEVIGHGEAVVGVTGNIIAVSGLDAGNYTLSVTTIADENHNSVTKTANIAVNKIDSALAVSDVVLDYGTSTNVSVTTEGAAGITARINDAEAVVENSTVLVPVLDAGNYTLSVATIADENHNSVTRNVTITVNKLKTDLAANAITATYNINKNLIITLKDANGKALAGVEITVNLGGSKTYAADINGQVKINVAKLVPKTYDVKVTFAGNANYLKSTADVKVTLKKATPKLTAKKKTFRESVKTKKYAITLKDNTGKAMKKVKLTLKIKGKTYKATTNTKGKATFKIKKLTKKGTFKAKVKFAGNAYYNAAAKTVKIKIK